MRWTIAVAGLLLLGSVNARAAEICTLVADSMTGDVIFQRGDCDSRVTPASTFKIPLAVMGYDSGFLVNAHQPVLDFKPGYPDWIESWRQPIDPTQWMHRSVVWYSQLIARALGTDRLSAYAGQWAYGNADFSGDPGENNGLERAWIASSLAISPAEQVRFLNGLVNRTLPVSRQAMDMAADIIERRTAGEWTVHGKTGSAYPRRADRSFDRARPWGWYVGWASKGERTIIFARLNQDERRTEGSSGVRARDGFIAELPQLLAGN